MQRFRLLRIYVAGLVAVIVVAVGGVSMRRAANDAATPRAPDHAAGTPSAPDVNPSVVEVSIADFAFRPKELVVTAGTAVTWVNTDGAPHTATSTASPPLFHSKTLETGGRFSFVFRAAGTYPYFCKFHPYMTGKVTVQ